MMKPKTGKKPGTDLKEGKITLPVIVLLENASEDEKVKVREIIVNENSDDENLAYIIELMKKYDVKRKSEEILDSYSAKAKESLKLFPENKYREALESLADYMIKREK
ncbi:MAG: polyprenyl synthetase family protein [Geovibrio sp.]|nr:polyprenyl synthetase family protein [Geovibrio sp.]